MVRMVCADGLDCFGIGAFLGFFRYHHIIYNAPSDLIEVYFLG